MEGIQNYHRQRKEAKVIFLPHVHFPLLLLSALTNLSLSKVITDYKTNIAADLQCSESTQQKSFLDQNQHRHREV